MDRKNVLGEIVVASLRAQKRNVLEFMTQSVQAARDGISPPSLLPQTPK
jgi:hypothetical protein